MSTRYQGTPAQVRALDAYIKLTRASETLAAVLDRSLRAAGLTGGQLAVLEALLHLGPMYERELGRKLLRSSGNVNTVVANLERDGYVKRQRSKTDMRYVNVELTGKGRKLISQTFPRHAQAITALMDALDEGEQDELARLCRKLGLAASAGPGPGS